MDLHNRRNRLDALFGHEDLRGSQGVTRPPRHASEVATRSPTLLPFLSVSAKAACFRIFWRLALETISPLAQARRREAVLSPDYEPLLADEINSLFDVFLLARLIVAGRRPGPLAARRRALGSKDLTRVIAKFLARKLISEPEQ